MSITSIPPKAMSYTAYVALVEKLLHENLSTGHVQTEAYLEYSKLNLQRMRRLDKTIVLGNELKAALRALKTPITWLVLSEGWCGDAAQNLPVLHQMSLENTNIRLLVLLRDDHPDVMDQYLTNGARAIPKLICLESSTLRELFQWGPRPAELQRLVLQLKDDGISKDDRSLAAQNWYNKNKSLSLQTEMLSLVRDL